MKKGNKIKKVFRYFSLLFIVALGLVSIIGTGGGGGGGGGTGGGSGTTNPVSINDDTPAGAQDASIAFNDAGDALAVWIADNGADENRILYSFYTSATGAWSDEAELSTGNTTGTAVCSDGTDFMVVWAQRFIYAREYIVMSSTWGNKTDIGNGFSSPYSPHVTPNGTGGYCAVWQQYDGTNTRIYANVYNGSTWGTETTVGSATGSAYPPKVASNGTGYCVTWSRNDSGTYNIYASIYTIGPSWSAETALEDITGYADYPQVASDGTGYCVTWNQDDGLCGSIYANVYTGGWGVATLIDSNDTYSAYYPKIASDGSGYGVVWKQYDGIVGYRVYGIGYDSSSGLWDDTPMFIDLGIGNCDNPDVAASTSGYGVTWRLYDSGSYNILARIYDRPSDTWDTETLLESGSGDADYPYIASDGTGYGVVWIQDDGSRNTVYANINNGSGWGTESNLMRDQYHGSVTGDIRFAANTSGDVLAIWRQYDNDRDNLFGCLFSGGTWGNVFQITDYLRHYDVSSDANGFMIVYNHYSTIYAVPYDTTTGLGNEEPISGNRAYDCRVASNGIGYCATWRQYNTPNYDIYANIYNGSSWDTEMIIESGSGGVYGPQVASNGTGYCVTWNQDDGLGTYDIWARIHNGSSWDPAATIESGPTNDAWYPQIASDGTGYCVTWVQDGDIHANVYKASWGTATTIEIATGWVESPQVASNGSSYGVTWEQYDGSATSIYVNLYDCLLSTWAGAMTIESGSGNAYYPRGASNGTGYCVSWVQDDGTAYSAYANTFDGSDWGTGQTLESSDNEVSYEWDRFMSVVATQDTYTIGWLQKDSNDPLVDNVWAYSGLSD